MNAIAERSPVPLLLLVLLPACGGAPVDQPPPDDGWLPGGVRMATVQKVTDGCALFITELREGRTLPIMLERDGEAVSAYLPGTLLPRLRAATHDRDRFRTDTRMVPITAKDGLCTARRTQLYEGRSETPTQYQVTFQSQDQMPIGDCVETPIPCTSAYLLAISWCSPRGGCPSS